MNEHEFAMYEYKEVSISSAQASFYLDCYENFGWKQDEHFAPQTRNEKLILKLKRNRKIANKVELTRLQRNFEADIKEIEALENSKTRYGIRMSVLIRTMMLQYRHGIYFILMRWKGILNHRMNLLYVPLTIITKGI